MTTRNHYNLSYSTRARTRVVFALLLALALGAGIGAFAGAFGVSSVDACCGGPAPTPGPGPAPLPLFPVIPVDPIPTCSLSANPSALGIGGGQSELSWTIQNATDAHIDNGVGNVPVGTNSTLVQVSASTNYTMTVTGTGGVTQCHTSVTVQPPPPPPQPPTCTLSANPDQIISADPAKLFWTTTDATTFSIDQGIGAVTPVASGMVSASPMVTTVYQGTAQGPGGVAHCQTKITVQPPPPPPGNQNPSCTLSANPGSVNAGDVTHLSWTTKDATKFSIDQGIGSVTPVTSGSVNSGAISNDTVFTGTASDAAGHTKTCTVKVTVTHGGGGGGGPSCTLSVAPQSYTKGGSAILSWGGSSISTVDIDNNVAVGTTSPGSVRVAPANVGNYVYTGTFHATNGQTLTCTAQLEVTGGSGGCSGNCGGGGATPPTVTLTSLPRASVQPLAYLYLSQIPYTGLDLGPGGTILYWLLLVAWSLALAYLVLFGAVPLITRRARTLGARVFDLLNTPGAVEPPGDDPVEAVSAPVAAPAEPSPKSPAPSVPPAAFAVPKGPPKPARVEESQEAPRGYSSYEGFRSFGANGALSVEDIVKGLAREYAARPSVPATERPLTSAPSASFKTTPPSVRSTVQEAATRAEAPERRMIGALLEGKRDDAFAALREGVQSGVAPEKLITSAVFLLDDAYRARVDGAVPGDAEVVHRAQRLDTGTLERLISALATAIDSSYSTGITGAKLALTRALAAVGA